MKTYLKILLIGMCVIAFACISYHRNHQKKFDNLFFEMWRLWQIMSKAKNGFVLVRAMLIVR